MKNARKKLKLTFSQIFFTPHMTWRSPLWSSPHLPSKNLLLCVLPLLFHVFQAYHKHPLWATHVGTMLFSVKKNASQGHVRWWWKWLAINLKGCWFAYHEMEVVKQRFGGLHCRYGTDPVLCNIVETSAALPNNSWHCQPSHVSLLPAVLEPSAGRRRAPWHQLVTSQVYWHWVHRGIDS